MTTSSLVERLQDYRSANDWGDPVYHVICDEAADHIERLGLYSLDIPSLIS